MTAITENEIAPGLVVFMDQQMLDDDERVFRTQDLPTVKARLFICYVRDGDESEWAPITTQHRSERLYLESAWRSGGEPMCSGGYAQWLSEGQYLADGANTYRGPAISFVEASHLECSAVVDRSRLSDEGVAAVGNEVERQRGRRHRP